MSRTFITDKNQCPYCKYVFDRCSDPSGLDSPQAGDLTVCINCSQVLVFDKALRPQKLPINELLRIQQEFPEEYDKILRLQLAIRSVTKRSDRDE